MKNILPFVALIFGFGIGSHNCARADEAPAQPTTPVTAPDAARNLLGKPFPNWLVSQNYWMNTPEPVWLGGLRGDVTVIEFFRINCSHCQDAAPARRALYEKYRGRGLKMVGFHSPGIIGDLTDDENKWEKVKAEVKKWGLNYPIAFDQNRAFFDQNEFRFYPTVVVLDGKGIVRFQQTGYSPAKAAELDAFVGQMLTKK